MCHGALHCSEPGQRIVEDLEPGAVWNMLASRQGSRSGIFQIWRLRCCISISMGEQGQ
jgi:hypothetical protein